MRQGERKRAATVAAPPGASAFGEAAPADDQSGAPASLQKARAPAIPEAIELGEEAPRIVGTTLRMRKLIREPGGAIPAHGPADRPAVVYNPQGRVREHCSDRDAAIGSGVGDSISEGAAAHPRIDSIGTQPLIGLVVDIPNPGDASALAAASILKAYELEPHAHD